MSYGGVPEADAVIARTAAERHAPLTVVDLSRLTIEDGDLDAVTFDFDGEKVVLTEEDLLIDMTQKEGYVTESNQDVTVVLDCNLTPELLEEGFVREIISKIQTMRKEAGFEVTDHITVGYKDNAKIETIFSKYADEICADVLADKLTDSEISGYTKEWSINGETVVLTVSKE